MSGLGSRTTENLPGVNEDGTVSASETARLSDRLWRLEYDVLANEAAKLEADLEHAEEQRVRAEEALRELMDCLTVDENGVMNVAPEKWGDPWCKALAVVSLEPQEVA